MNKLNFRGYDKLNRLLYSADAYTDGDIPYWDELNPDNTYDFENYNNHQESFLTVNVYDTLSTAFAGNIFYPPQDYYNAPNFSIGNLCATAYRTIGTEDWNLKYYRYDARGRVIKMWNIIDGFTSTFEYIYNSANQIARMIQNDDMSNTKDFRYGYDPWGYELTGRAYIDTLKYKFTGKERDKESTYDYFGARYYDSRIGRWLQMEPLYDKYINFTPYLYSILNPIKYFDKNGMDIYLKGENAQQVFDYLKSELKNLNLHFNSETGEITLESKGDELTKAESKFLEALNNKDVIVNLNLTDKNTIETGEPFQVGAYEGCTNIEVNGKIYTVSKQTFNLEHAKLWEQVGGSSIGYSALHEIIESYLGAEGKNSIHSNLDIISKILHIETLKLLPEYTVQMVKVYVRINERLKRDDYWLSGTTDSKYLYSIYK